MPKIFFISDTHFGDKDILNYENRPFTNVEEMNKTMVSNWNLVVSDDDIVFVVGDFFSDFKYIPLINQLNGHIRLIVGNHDIPFLKELSKYKNIQIIEYPIILDEFWMISHEPMYINENMPYVNIFGHVHNNPMYKTISTHSYCVCVERNNFMPVDFEYIKELIRKENNNGK